MKTDELRKRYLEFFKKRNHKVFPSDTLVPDDPSLLFTSAGMNQFKPYFLGEKKGLKRAASCQKCLRTGDLEKVGKTPYHHTFFEMLGNFSFGDYFKKEAIELAWIFLTKDLNMKEKDLWVSIYKDDKEAFGIWKDYIGIPINKIIKLGEESNFWPASAPSRGPDGPCGPCSEIFFDRGKSIGCGRKTCSPACDCGRFVEVWNLVFIQFNRKGKNNLEPLPQNNIDTGMGLERMASVLQGKASNFEIDILAPIVEFVNKEIVKNSRPKSLIKSSINAIVDHARAVTFAIADGVFPSNEERGYVIRKIIRKALLHSRALDNKKPFLYKLPELFVQFMGNFYPEIGQKKDNISKIILAEEKKYFSMIKAGKAYANIMIGNLKKTNKNIVESEEVFFLYDTYGLPLEFIRELAQEKGFKIDEKGFKELLKAQQERSRKASMFDESIFRSVNFDLKEKSEFIGYDTFKADANIIKLFMKDKEVKIIDEGQDGLIVLDRTPFYPESGGQLNDKGVIKTEIGEFAVDRVFRISDAIIHQGKVIKGKISRTKAVASINIERRKALARAHTATHLLQAALRIVLGTHVTQQGSLVDEDKFRFDFTHFSKLTDEELERIESKVRKFISEAQRVEKRELTLEEAKKEGALAFFKDKYQDKVRVVSVSDYSKELCGGTHVGNTSEIEDFAIISESSISSGIRRIKAVVAKEARAARAIRSENKQVKKVREGYKKASQKRFDQIVAKEEKKIISSTGNIIGLENINGINFLLDFDKVNSSSSQEQSRIILMLSDKLRQRLGSGFIFIVRNVSGKDIFICSATDDLVKKGISCKEFVSTFSKELSLVGGGKERLVQGCVLNRSDDFLKKVKVAFRKFTHAPEGREHARG